MNEEETTSKRRIKLITADFDDVELSSRKQTIHCHESTYTSEAEYYEVDMLSTPRAFQK